MTDPIVVASAWGSRVSFTGVLRRVLSALAPRPVFVVALDLDGEVRVEGHVTLIPGRCEGYGPRKAQLLFEVVRRVRPAAVFFYFDLFAAQFHYPVLLEIQRNLAPVVMYLPIDGTLCNVHPLRPATAFERLVFFTAAARARFLALNRELNSPGQQSLESRCSVIPHGVSRSDFFPAEGGTQMAKRIAFPDRPELEPSSILLNANHPWERKRLDLTLQGFARFLHGTRKDVCLYLHLPGALPEQLAALERQAEELGIRSKVLMGHSGWKSVEEMNWIYNACEVGINTAMGEGWGLVSCEHGASGAAQILPDDEQLREIWGDAAVYTKTASLEQNWACPHVEYRVVDIDSVAECLVSLFSDAALRRNRSQAAALRMQESRFDWEMIKRQWADLFAAVSSAATPSSPPS